jgi:hypothetical protein
MAMTGKMPEILLYSPQESPRVSYIACIIFEVFRSLPYRIVHSTDTFLAYPGPKINYSHAAIAGPDREIFLPASGLLFEAGCGAKKPEPTQGLSFPAFFPVNAPGADFAFDLPAMIFYFLSRYEEYQSFRADRFGRFPATESLSYQYHTLDLPLVDIWLNQLYDALESKWKIPPIPRAPYRYLPTYDVDIAWAYRYRPWWRQLLASGKSLLSLEFNSLAARLKSLSGHPDPYDQYAFLHGLHTASLFQPLYFFLLGNYARFDRNIDHQVPALRALIRAKGSMAGLHPSMASNFNAGRLALEKERLETITGTPATQTRQHYLFLSFPETYRRLASAGFEMDYSMGFADLPGFRAGTGTAFPWYDLLAERRATLWVQPFQVMDVTLKDYLGLNPSEAADRIAPILQQSKAVGTTFCTIWHNSSFYAAEGWEAWPEMYIGLVEAANNLFSLQKKP